MAPATPSRPAIIWPPPPAFSILEAGGNAIDAGCAAGMALGVLQPDLVNVAGVAPIMIRLADGTVESIAGLGWWPKSLPADLFMREHGGTIPDGVLRTVVPAAPDAWITALDRHGTMRFADVAAYGDPLCAAEGFAVYPLLATLDRRARARIPALAVQRGGLPAGQPRAEVGREIRPVRPRPHAAVHGRPGPRRGAGPAWPGCRPRTTPSIAATSPARSPRFQAARGRLSHHGGPRRYHSPHRAGGASATGAATR